MEESLKARWHQICELVADKGYLHLSEAERFWFSGREFIDSVENGGCISYFYNSGADHLDDCRALLRILGAQRALKELDRVCSLFGSTVPDDIDRRNDIINSWPDGGPYDATLEDVDDVLMPLMGDLESRLARYVNAHVPAP